MQMNPQCLRLPLHIAAFLTALGTTGCDAGPAIQCYHLYHNEYGYNNDYGGDILRGTYRCEPLRGRTPEETCAEYLADEWNEFSHSGGYLPTEHKNWETCQGLKEDFDLNASAPEEGVAIKGEGSDDSSSPVCIVNDDVCARSIHGVHVDNGRNFYRRACEGAPEGELDAYTGLGVGIYAEYGGSCPGTAACEGVTWSASFPKQEEIDPASGEQDFDNYTGRQEVFFTDSWCRRNDLEAECHALGGTVTTPCPVQQKPEPEPETEPETEPGASELETGMGCVYNDGDVCHQSQTTPFTADECKTLVESCPVQDYKCAGARHDSKTTVDVYGKVTCKADGSTGTANHKIYCDGVGGTYSGDDCWEL